MCGVLHRNLGKGARCALPLHPSGLGSSWVLNPSRAIRTYRRSITRGRLRSPCTHRSFQEDQRLSHPWNHEQGLETCLSTCTEPCTNVWPSDHQSGERSCSHRYPHDHFMETISSRPEREHFIAALPWSHPIEQGLSCPLHPRPPLRRLELRHLAEVGTGSLDCGTDDYISGNINCSDLYNSYSKYNL